MVQKKQIFVFIRSMLTSTIPLHMENISTRRREAHQNPGKKNKHKMQLHVFPSSISYNVLIKTLPRFTRRLCLFCIHYSLNTTIFVNITFP